jgi:acyl-homoserine-lactone acylase
MNLALLQNGKPKLSIDDLRGMILDGKGMTAELQRADVVARCQGAVKAKPDAKLARACETLAAWDGRYDVTSRGAVLWRELGDLPYAVAFDPDKPVETPRGLAPAPPRGDDPVIASLRAAIARLESAHVDPFGPLGAAQWVDKRGKKLPVPGSSPDEGSTNPAFYSTWNTTRLPRSHHAAALNPDTGLGDGGYAVNYGTSFLMVVGFTDRGPVAYTLMTYSASSDPRSPNFADQTAMYANKQWRPVRASDPPAKTEQVCSSGC